MTKKKPIYSLLAIVNLSRIIVKPRKISNFQEKNDKRIIIIIIARMVQGSPENSLDLE